MPHSALSNSFLRFILFGICVLQEAYLPLPSEEGDGKIAVDVCFPECRRHCRLRNTNSAHQLGPPMSDIEHTARCHRLQVDDTKP